MGAPCEYKFVEADNAPADVFPLIVSTTSTGVELRFDLPDAQRHRLGLRIMCGLIGVICLALCSFLVVVAEFQWMTVLVCIFVVWIAVTGPYVAHMFAYKRHVENNPLLKWDRASRQFMVKERVAPEQYCQLVLLEVRVDIELLKVQLQLIDTSSSSSRVFVLLHQFQKLNKKSVRMLNEFATASGCQLVHHTVR
jgi:hypothetical protein